MVFEGCFGYIEISDRDLTRSIEGSGMQSERDDASSSLAMLFPKGCFAMGPAWKVNPARKSDMVNQVRLYGINMS